VALDAVNTRQRQLATNGRWRPPAAGRSRHRPAPRLGARSGV